MAKKLSHMKKWWDAMAKIYAISDIHGYLDEFIDALNKVNLNDKDNRLFLLGDYLDNGLQSFRVISKII